MCAMEEARRAAKLAAMEEELPKEEEEPRVEDVAMEDIAKDAPGVEPDGFAMAEVEAEFQNSKATEAAAALEAKQQPSSTQFSPSSSTQFSPSKRWPTTVVSTSRTWSWTSCLDPSETMTTRRS